MSKIIALVTLSLSLSLGACVHNNDKEEQTGCIQQAEQACDPNDKECMKTIVEDCEPPTCNAPVGQHC